MAKSKYFDGEFQKPEDEKPKEEKQEVKVEEKIPEAPQKLKERSVEPPRIILSPTDAYLYDRMKSQPTSLEEVDLKVEEKIPEGRHRLSLPPEFDEFKKKYTFRWIFKSKRAIDEACDIKGWVLCNRSLFPGLADHFFTVSGTIERGDNVLAFMTNEKAEIIRKRPGQVSSEKIKSTFERHLGNPLYYTPAPNEKEKEEEGMTQVI